MDVDNMSYVHPKDWSDDRLTLYPQLTSTPLSRGGPQTPSAPYRGQAPTVTGRTQLPLPSDAVPTRGGPLRGSTLHVQGYSSQRPPPEIVYQPGRPRERSLDHGNVFRGGRGPAGLHRTGASTPSHPAYPAPSAGVGVSVGAGDMSCESSYISNDSFESRPPTNPLISKRGIPSISSGIPTMGTSTIHGRYLPGGAAGGALGTASGAGGGRYLPPAALGSHYIPGVTGTEKLSGHAGCGKEVAFRLKQSRLAGMWRKMADSGSGAGAGGRRRSCLLLCLLLFCIGLLIGAVSVVVYLTDDDPGDMMAFQGQFTITNKVFQEGYRDPGSDEYRRLATEIETQLNKLFRKSNLSSVYNESLVLGLEPAYLDGQRNMTAVTVLVRLNEPRPDGAIGIGTSFIEGMRNAHRRMWLGRRITVKLDDISFSVSRSAVPPPPPVTRPSLPPSIDVRWGEWEAWAPCVPCRPSYTQTRERRCLLNNAPACCSIRETSARA
ncbi:hypothetical protein FJT64_000342 [Amphibalanus amphitrite]|uniref:SEA domain-containing protein n=1 Tax=Amphibalanus amphitrite TaxID=1232801 RepID=A0A6A4WFQ7_AMPAM|nr:hypothetical protein FJT64_000342 [Amphibalanus amphitrite]